MGSGPFAGRRILRSCRGLLVGLLVVWASAQAQVHLHLPSHPLEEKALTEPVQALAEIETLLQAPEPSALDLTVLYLAKSNACRVLANWQCQRDAAIDARRAAESAKQPLLAVRAMILESRGRIAIQDFVRGEQVLAEAQSVLKQTPDAELAADVYLAFSTLSNAVGKYAAEAENAQAGVAALGDVPAHGTRARLLRNLARAQGHLGDIPAARAALSAARDAAANTRDPKLAAELDLEMARLARTQGDTAEQVASGARILTLAKQVKNSQLEGIGREVLGLTAMDLGNWSEAQRNLHAAYRSFSNLKLDRDALRVLRELVRLELDHGDNREVASNLVRDLITLEVKLDTSERALAGADYDARLKYAQQNFELETLAHEAALAREREVAGKARTRLQSLLLIAVGVALLVVAGFLYAQRLSNQRLRVALAAQKASERALEASEHLLRSVTDNVPALIAYVDLDQRYRFTNGFYRVMGNDPEAMIGRTVQEVRGEELYEFLREHVDAALAGQPSRFEGRTEINGQERFFQTNYIPDVGPDGKVRGFFSMTLDITGQKQAEHKLDVLSRTDELSGVANRRHFDERLRAALSRSQRHHHGLALLYLDIDHFKEINDRYGHSAGDEVIREFANRLQACVRTEDLVARLGGDEFVVLAEDIDEVADAEQIARKLIHAMEQPIKVGIYSIKASASVGVALLSNVDDTNLAMKLADDALYAAKSAGRNTWQVAVTRH